MAFNTQLKESLERKKNSTPQRSNLWVVRLPELRNTTSSQEANKNLPSIRRGTDNKNSLSVLNDLSEIEDMNHRVVSISTPSKNFETYQVPDGNTSWYSIAGYDLDNLTLTVEEYQDSLTYRYFTSWQDLGAPNPKNDYYAPPAIWKRDIEFYRIDITKKFWLQKVTFKHCFPVGINEVSNTYEEPDILTYDINIQSDRMVREFQNVESEIQSYEKELLRTQVESKYEFSSVDESRVSDIINRISSRVIFG